MLFTDRTEAGRLLAEKPQHYRGTDAVILAIPRCWVPVACKISRETGLPMRSGSMSGGWLMREEAD